MPIVQSLTAARNLTFAPTLSTEYSGGALPIDGATASMQVRAYEGAAGDPLAEDADVGMSDEATPTDDDPERRTLTLTPSIARAALAALPGQNTPEAGDPQGFKYEIKITYDGGAQDSLWIGDFILLAGVDDT